MQWEARLTRNLSVVCSNQIKDCRCLIEPENPHCLVLVGLRYGFDCDSTNQLNNGVWKIAFYVNQTPRQHIKVPTMHKYTRIRVYVNLNVCKR